MDTPGFGDGINNEPSFQEILSYVEKQYDAVLNEEARVKRNTKSVDSRVHCILYFLTPNGHGLREVDVTFIRKLGSRANVLPVIAKSDSLTPRELIDFKKKVIRFILRTRFRKIYKFTNFHSSTFQFTKRKMMKRLLKKIRA